MQSNYRRLGDYVRLVDERNRNLEVKNLSGLTINKVFIPSVANTVGTDMSTYKIIRKNQFACSTMQVRRDKKMPVALWKEDEPAIISAAYPVFEIMDEQQLFPEYLMMWFSRSEFDREACFLAVGGVRGSLEWEDFLNMEFPLPTLEKQKELVAEYQTVEQRIQLNNRLCEKLEETAQTIYRHWFEDFEFPVQRHCEERGTNDEAISMVAEPQSPYNEIATLPLAMTGYKSSGGAMVYNEELGKEIPEGWKVVSVKHFCKEMKNGATPSRDNLDYWNSNDIPWIKTGEISNNIIIEAEEYISTLGFRNSSTKLIPKNAVLMAMYGATASQLGFLKFETTTNQACCAMICNSYDEASFLYYSLLNKQI
ncbi:restriction endonuclease subunit S [Chryseobacterium suipulveris]|uniref:Restriction endonuclease subunit S n=1 Tax=Chryseobacterium suipulveris TaxID=2929800 RepID=A0ABY4BND2_9FLAO|nr:restriction endonuclease subunit S [Chryseobacterium suipulveris]UOE40289.1 restriction endonuclease subunit S [Chryseobacterium suipulveris]